MTAALKEALGPEWKKYLPLLWEQDFDSSACAKVRLAYMDAVTHLVQKNFSEQIGAWCRAHGVQYIGHLIEDNNQHSRTGSSLGHYFRGLAGQDMAGIDDIGGQVLPCGEHNGPFGLMGDNRNGRFYHYVLGRLGASLAVLDPIKHGDCLCEIFGNYGWEEGVRLEKYLADHFLVRGVNHFVPHAFSMKAYPDPDCPPHFFAHGHNPQFRHFGALMGCMEAFAQGTVPLIADSELSSTSAYALTERNRYQAGNAEELADKIDYWYAHQDDLFAMGQRYVDLAKTLTIEKSAAKARKMMLDAIGEFE